MADFGAFREVDGRTYIRCAVLNTMMALDVPSRSLPILMAESCIVEPLWPLGLHFGFDDSGMTIGLYGLTSYGASVLWTSHRTPAATARMGSLYFSLWSLLRSTPSVDSDFTRASLMRASSLPVAS